MNNLQSVSDTTNELLHNMYENGDKDPLKAFLYEKAIIGIDL